MNGSEDMLEGFVMRREYWEVKKYGKKPSS